MVEMIGIMRAYAVRMTPPDDNAGSRRRAGSGGSVSIDDL